MWAFLLILHLTGSDVTATVTAKTWAACDETRHVVLRELGRAPEIEATATKCVALASIEGPT